MKSFKSKKLVCGFNRTTKLKNLVCGFTMVEVLVVIGIIAILTVIIFPAVNEIRAKNRDSERVSDIATIQLALSLYYNQNISTGYPKNLDDLSPKFLPADALVGPNGEAYQYVPLNVNGGAKCTYYHLGAQLELTSAQIDSADQFDSRNLTETTSYKYCGDNTDGIDGTAGLMYDVRP